MSTTITGSDATQPTEATRTLSPIRLQARVVTCDDDSEVYEAHGTTRTGRHWTVHIGLELFQTEADQRDARYKEARRAQDAG